MPSGAELLVRITGKNDLGPSLDKAGGEVESFGAKIEKLGPKMIAAGAAIGGAGVYLTRLADEGKRATGQLQVAIENSGDSFDDLAPRISQVSERLIKLGHDDEATARSLATLTTATQDPAKALDSMGLAADIAAARHISLESAADKLAKMYSGNARIFKEFGITLGANATETERAAAVTELMNRVQGQAAVQADTFGNKLEVAKIRLENMGEAIGAKVGPALTVAGPLLAGVGGIIQSGLVPALISGVSSAASFAVGMAGAAASAVAAAVPVIIAWAPVILTVAAIGAAAYLLYRNWDTIWSGIKEIASTAADWIMGNLEYIAAAVLLPLAPIILLITHWEDAWAGIKAVTGAAVSWLGDAISSGISSVVEVVGSLPGRMLAALGDVGSFLFSAGEDLIRGLINGILNMAGRAASAALNVVKGAVNAAKNFLGIGSPSKLFAGFGLNIGEGLAQGLARSEGLVAQASSALAGTTAPSFAQGAPSYATGSGSTLDPQPIAAAITAALAPLIAQLRQAGMTNVFPPGTNPQHAARELAWAMG